MNIIQMDTEQVEELTRKLMRSATEIFDKGDSLRNSAQRLQNNWSGGRSDRITGQIRNISNQMNSLANQMDDLANLTHREIQQWLEVDGSKQSFFSKYWGNVKYNYSNLVGDVTKIGAVGYIISKFHDIPTRPNSVSIHGPDWLVKSIGLNPNARVMKPETIQKQLLGSSAIWKGGLLAGVIDGGRTGWDTFLNGEYAGTSRAVPAAFVDSVVKGVATGVVTAGLIALTGVIIGTAAAPVAAAAATIGICVIGGAVINTFVVDPLFKVWQDSYAHDQAVEGAARIGNTVSNFVQHTVQTEIDRVRNAFAGFISPVAYSPA